MEDVKLNWFLIKRVQANMKQKMKLILWMTAWKISQLIGFLTKVINV